MHTAEILRTQEVAKDVETLALTWRDYLDQNDGASREELYERVVAVSICLTFLAIGYSSILASD